MLDDESRSAPSRKNESHACSDTLIAVLTQRLKSILCEQWSPESKTNGVEIQEKSVRKKVNQFDRFEVVSNLILSEVDDLENVLNLPRHLPTDF